MKTVWKIKFNNIGVEERIALPQHAKFLHFGIQNGFLHAWFEVNPRNALVGHKFKVIGTGHEISDSFNHLGTCQRAHMDQYIVWHLYKYYACEEPPTHIGVDYGKEQRTS